MIFRRRQSRHDTARAAATTSDEATPAEDRPSRATSDGDHRPAGMRLTEKRLLPIFGPAQVGDSTAPLRPASEAERSRDRALRTTLTRVVGKDGKSYVVAVPDEPAAPADGPATNTDAAADMGLGAAPDAGPASPGYTTPS